MSAALKTADLPAEALSFIKEGTPKPHVRPVGPSDSFESPSVEPPPPAPKTMDIAPESKPKTPAKVSSPMPASLVGLSFRLPADIHHALMRASFERKMQRQEPWTQQEIAAEALSLWLKKQGYI